MPIAWHLTRWLDWSMPKVETKEIEPSFADGIISVNF